MDSVPAPTSNNGSFYKMSRTLDGSARLTLQHYLWKLQLGWSLHPSISATWQSSANDEYRIADIACGNGIWTLEQVASPLPCNKRVSAVGFDVSAQQFPPLDTWPEGVEFKVWNFYDSVPAQYHEYFDVVHVRLILAAIPDGNPLPILKNLISMLKPGGYLQWSETEIAGPILAKRSTAIHKLTENVFSEYGKRANHDWIKALPELFDQSGLQQIDAVQGHPPTHMRKYWWDCLYQGFRELVEGAKSDRLSDFYSETVAELANNNESAVWRNHVVIGRKVAIN